jgi:hypothetical protein
MISSYQRFHTTCLRDEEIPPGPGELIVCLREPITFGGPQSEFVEPGQMRFEQGAILHGDIELTSVKDAVRQHLTGTALSSEVRFGAGVLLGLEPATTAPTPAEETLIDDWLDHYTFFVFQLTGPDDDYVPHPAPVGLFNGIVSNWQLQWAVNASR